MIKTYIFLEPSQPACSPDFDMQQESINPIIYNGRLGKNNVYFEKLLAYNDFH